MKSLILMCMESLSGEEPLNLKKFGITPNMILIPSLNLISPNLMFKLELKLIGLFGMKIFQKKLMD